MEASLAVVALMLARVAVPVGVLLLVGTLLERRRKPRS
jgi:hypothetical protein